MSDLDTHLRQHDATAATVLSVQAQQDLAIHAVALAAASVDPDHATLCRRIGNGRHVYLPIIKSALEVHLAPDQAPGEWPEALTLAGPDGRIEIKDGARLLRALTAIDLDTAEDGPDGHWQWLQSVILGRLADTPFSSCEEIARGPQPAIEDDVVLRVILRSSGHMVSTHLRAGTATWLTMLANGNWSPLRQPLSEYMNLATQATVELGRHVYSAGALRTVAAGDILVPESPRFTPAGEGWIAFGRIKAQVRYTAQGTLTVLGVTRHSHGESAAGSDADQSSQRAGIHLSKGKNMDEQYDEGEKRARKTSAEGAQRAAPKEAAAAETQRGASAVDPGASSELDTVDLTLHFELGKVRMSLGEIRTLTTGAIVLFNGGSPESVAIVSSGQVLGQGEVVDVGGRLGIRVTHWGQQGE
jgi:type III secretion protein Q